MIIGGTRPSSAAQDVDEEYRYVCIGDLTCEPWDEDRHSAVCHRENDVERHEFYVAALVDETRARLSAGAPRLGMLAERLRASR
jgi:hypothetical protein